MIRRTAQLWMCLWLLWAAPPAMAQELQEVESTLSSTIEALRSATREQQELAKRNDKLRSELSHLQKDLVSIASRVQQQEKILSELEANLLNLRDEEREMHRNLERRKHEQAQTLQSMLRLSRIPPEVVVAMPGDFAHTLRTSKVLAVTTKTLAQQAEEITRELEAIHALQAQIRDNYQQIDRQKTLLLRNEKTLATRLDTRSEIQNRLLSEQEQRQREVERLSRQSNTLKELMAQLEARHKEAEKKAAKLAMIPPAKPDPTSMAAPTPTAKPAAPRAQAPAPAPATQDSASQRFAKAKGRIALPAEGKIFTLYGDKTPDGTASRGIVIRTRDNAKVTAPFAGEIVYTGSFLDYGNMVILRHEEKYHSLLAGFERISANLGQQVIAGEPIGEMGRNTDKTALYMEIRENNRPIDPLPWLETRHYATR